MYFSVLCEAQHIWICINWHQHEYVWMQVVVYECTHRYPVQSWSQCMSSSSIWMYPSVPCAAVEPVHWVVVVVDYIYVPVITPWSQCIGSKIYISIPHRPVTPMMMLFWHIQEAVQRLRAGLLAIFRTQPFNPATYSGKSISRAQHSFFVFALFGASTGVGRLVDLKKKQTNKQTCIKQLIKKDSPRCLIINTAPRKFPFHFKERPSSINIMGCWTPSIGLKLKRVRCAVACCGGNININGTDWHDEGVTPKVAPPPKSSCWFRWCRYMLCTGKPPKQRTISRYTDRFVVSEDGTELSYTESTLNSKLI